MKTWTRPDGKWPKFFHTTLHCTDQLVGEKYSAPSAPAGVALCPDCEAEMMVMAKC